MKETFCISVKSDMALSNISATSTLKVSGLIPRQVKSKAIKLTPDASLVSVHPLRARAGLSRLAWCQYKVPGWGSMLICGMVLQCTDTLKVGLSLDQLQQI